MIKFGWAETDITPKEKIALQGEFFERVTSEVETPLTVTALAIDADGDQTVFVSCDLVEIPYETLLDVRGKVKAPGLDPAKIIISAVHIHNSYTMPAMIPFPYEKGRNSLKMIMEYKPADCVYVPEVTNDDCLSTDASEEYLAGAIAKTVETAWANRAEGGYAAGFGRAAVGMNRRVCYSDGTAKMWGDVDTATFTELEGGNDNGVEMLFVYNAKKKLTGVVANIACPAQVMEQRSIISADYWGKVKILLREKYGKDIFLLPLCAAAGDQCPRDLIRWVEPETPIKDPNVIRVNPKPRDADPSMFDVKGTWKIGRRVFNEIEMALEEVGEIKTEAVHRHTVEKLVLPLRRVTDAECAAAKQAIADFFKGRTTLNYMDSAALYVYAGTILRHKLQEHNSTLPIEVQFVRLGDLAFASNPFELFLDYGNQIRARSAARQTFLLQLTNGSLGYLPTEKAEKHGHYSAYVSSGYVGHEAGALLVSESLDAINRLFDIV